MKKKIFFCLAVCMLLSVSASAAEDCDSLGHDWVSDAGVLICSRCGAVDDSEERAAIEMAEARSEEKNAALPTENISAPLSESTENEYAADEPDFEKFGIVPDMKYREVYPFTTNTRDMSALSTTGDVSVTWFDVLEPDSGHPEREGYHWCCTIMQSTFSDENARKNGVKVMALCDDYYNTRLRGTSQRLDADGYTAYSVLYNGQEMECRYKRTGTWSEWTTDESGRRFILYSCKWELEIPDGYDGTVIGVYSSDVDWPDGAYIDEVYSPDTFHLFRVS